MKISLFKERGFILVLTLMGTALLLIAVSAFIVMAMKGADEANLYRNGIGAQWELERVALLIKAELRWKIAQNAKAYQNPNGSASDITVFRPEDKKSTKFWKFWEGVTNEGSEFLPDEANRPDNNTISEADWDKMLEATGWNEGEASDWRALESRLIVERARRPFKARFRFSVHEQGSKYNVNIAGLGNVLPVNRTAPRGSMVNADLLQDPSIPKVFVDELQKFRWGDKFDSTNAEKQSALSLYGTTGFEKIPEGMNVFLDRSEYLEFCRQTGSPVLTEAFTTFSKEFNGPTWTPTFNGSTFSTYKFKNLYTYKYLDECNTPYTASKRSPNRDLANARNEEGKPLLRKRFPLSRLKLLESAEGAVGKDDDIYKYFGLTRASINAPWVYEHGGSDNDGNTRIYQIHEPAFLAEKRDPDFFELLQAGILAGSLGLTSNSSDTNMLESNSGSAFLVSLKDQPDLATHIFKIGANLIDQSDADGWPTQIQFKARDYSNKLTITYSSALSGLAQNGMNVIIQGQEKIPYVKNMFYNFFQINGIFDLFFNGNHWNVYRTPNESTNDEASKFRLSLRSGSFRLQMHGTLTVNPFTNKNYYSSVVDFSNTKPTIGFTGGSRFNTPRHFVSSDDLDNSISNQIKPYFGSGDTGNMMGAYLIDNFSYIELEPALIGASPYSSGKGVVFHFYLFSSSNNAPTSTVSFQYLRKNGNTTTDSDWITIQEFVGGGHSKTNTTQNWDDTSWGNRTPYVYCFDVGGSQGNTAGWAIRYPYNGNDNQISPGLRVPIGLYNNFNVDPRTDRLGMLVGVPSVVQNHSLFSTHMWAWGGKSNIQRFLGNCFIITGSTGTFSLASLCDNVNGIKVPRVIDPYDYSTITYNDLDGVNRRADGKISLGVAPIDAAREDEKPVILNRPFRSVAEMGYAYRDLPWKSLNFFSADSADAALLDLFCVEDDSEITSGKLDLNLVSAKTLQPLLEGASLDPIDEQQTLTPSSSVASTIVEKVNGHFYTRSELATRLTEFYPEAIDRNKAIKVRREGVVRALADSVQTRTANLMVNIVLQLGREKNGLFNVRGESHRWYHLAIDRFTNEVVWEECEDPNE